MSWLDDIIREIFRLEPSAISAELSWSIFISIFIIALLSGFIAIFLFYKLKKIKMGDIDSRASLLIKTILGLAIIPLGLCLNMLFQVPRSSFQALADAIMSTIYLLGTFLFLASYTSYTQQIVNLSTKVKMFYTQLSKVFFS